MSLVCEFCGKEYSHKYNLVRHQKTAKKCLNIQQCEAEKLFECTGCTNTFTLKQHLTSHHNVCVPYVEIKLSEEYEFQLIEKDEELKNKDKELQRKDEEIKKLRKELSKRSVVNNITNNNTNIIKDCVIIAVTPELFEKHKHSLTDEHVDAGAFGIARYAADYPLKDVVKCKDISRKVLEYHNEEGKSIKDQDGLRLTPAFFKENLPEIQSKINSLFMKYSETMFDDPEILGLQMTRLTDILTGVKAGARGEKTDFTQDWVKTLTSLLASGCSTQLHSHL